tara:strand:+ start:3517 stop:3957 length:441 start_codon:yes stop_codon:yes gene_type:complete
MEKENKTITIITKAALKKNVTQYDYCYGNERQKNLIKNNIKNKKLVVVFDITYSLQYKEGHKFYVKDHINKTGKNPLLKQKPIKFVDLTDLYISNKKSITTTSFGEKFNLSKNQSLFPSTEMALISILCRKENPKVKIKGILVNCI